MGDVDQQILDNFKEVCAVDDDKALQFLRHCDGNLENAVQLFFTTGGSLENSNEGAENAENADNELRRRNVAGSSITPNSAPIIRATPHTRPQVGWMQWIVTIMSLPVRFSWSVMWDIIGFIGQLFLGRNVQAVTDPTGDVNRFIENYHSKLLPTQTTPLPFVPLGFSETVGQAKSNVKMLLVYLHGPNEADARFVREILHDPVITAFIDQYDLMLWGCSVEHAEGKQVAFSLRARGYPFIGLLAFRNNKLNLAVKVDRMMNAQDLVANLQFTAAEYSAQMRNQRLERAQRDADAALRAEQNRDYEESRQRDRERAERRLHEEQERKNAEELMKKREQDKLDRIETIKTYRASAVPSDSGSVRVQVRFPSGDKAILLFEPEAPVTTVFDSILAQSACPDYFSVATTFPRKVISVAPAWYVDLTESNVEDGGTSLGVGHADDITVTNSGIQNGTALMVQDLNA